MNLYVAYILVGLVLLTIALIEAHPFLIVLLWVGVYSIATE